MGKKITGMMKALLPRLNYHYSLHDSIVGLEALFKSKKNYESLYSLFNSKNLFFFNHARTGLKVLLSSLELKEGSTIGVQAFNCNTVFESIKRAGYTPLFIDINDHFTMDVEDLKNKRELIDAQSSTTGISFIISFILSISAGIPKVCVIISASISSLLFLRSSTSIVK
jgi:hypothetical protein